MTNDMILALSEAQGVMNVNFVSGFVGGQPSSNAEIPNKPDPDNMLDPFDFLTKKGSGYSPPMDLLLDQFDLAIKLAGPERVGIGSDFDGASYFAAGLDDISCMPLVTHGLLERGHSVGIVEGILGTNNIRLFEKSI